MLIPGVHGVLVVSGWCCVGGVGAVVPVVTKLQARFHFGCVGFETAVTCLFVFYSSMVCGWFLAKVQHGALQS